MDINIDEVLLCFYKYMEFATNKKPPSKKEYLLNMMEKEADPNFKGDMEALLRKEIDYNQDAAFEWLRKEVIEKM